MSTVVLKKATGLQSAHNPFSGVQEGALGAAKNVVIFANGVIEPRRGHRNLDYALPTAEISNAGTFFGSTLVVQHGTSLSYDTGSAFTAFSGTFEPVDDALLRMKFAEAKSNLHANTDAGLKVIPSDMTVRAAGLPAPRLVYLPPSAPGTTRVAVRATFAYTDDNGVVHEGPPSYRYVIYWSFGSTEDITFEADARVPAGTVIRVYATEPAPDAATDPGDEMYQFIEIAYADWSGGTAHSISQYLLSDVPLYTNPRVNGINQQNTAPPIAKDITWHADRLWYANTTSPHRFSLRLLGTGSGVSEGFVTADTLTIDGVVATGYTVTSGGSASANIEATASSLAKAINDDASMSVTAYYVSEPNGFPGTIVLESKTLGDDAFTVYSSKTTCWEPVLTSSSTGALTSDNNRLPHGLFYSKPDQPEAVPLLNYLLIGSKNKEILRVLPLREKLFVFKEDGIYTVSGEEPFRVDCLDEKTRLVSPDSAVVLNNQILCFTNQGVCAVSDVGVQILSRAIEDELHPFLNSAQRSLIKRYAFGVAHETDRTYELWLPGPGVSDPTLCNTCFVYNVITQTWTTWEAGEKTWGTVSPTDVRYYGGDTDGTVYKERRDFASSDYADDVFSVTVSGFAGTTLTLASVVGITVGDCITLSKSGSSQSEVITAVGATTITVSAAILTAFQTGATAIIERAFECDVRYLPQSFDRPGTAKRFQYGTLHFARPTSFVAGYATYSTETSAATTTDALVSNATGWGSSEWGSAAFGDPVRNINMRHIIPAEKQRASMLYPGFRIREAKAGWRFLGVSLEAEETSERGSK